MGVFILWGVQETLRACLESTLLPAFERSCQVMFEQIDTTFASNMANHTSHTQQQFAASHTALASTLKVRPWCLLLFQISLNPKPYNLNPGHSSLYHVKIWCRLWSKFLGGAGYCDSGIITGRCIEGRDGREPEEDSCFGGECCECKCFICLTSQCSPSWDGLPSTCILIVFNFILLLFPLWHLRWACDGHGISISYFFEVWAIRSWLSSEVISFCMSKTNWILIVEQRKWSSRQLACPEAASWRVQKLMGLTAMYFFLLFHWQWERSTDFLTSMSVMVLKVSRKFVL